MESLPYLQAVPPELINWYALGWLTFGVTLGYLLSQEIPYLLALWSRLTAARLQANPHRPEPQPITAHDAPEYLADRLANHQRDAATVWAANRPRNRAGATAIVVGQAQEMATA